MHSICKYCQSAEPCYDGYTLAGYPCQHPEFCNGQKLADEITNDKCEHLTFACECDVNRLPTKEGGPVERYCMDVRVKCADCGLPFRFIGLPAGLDLNGASVSIGATEGHFAIAPKGQVVSVLDGAIGGFSVRREQLDDTKTQLQKIRRIAAHVSATEWIKAKEAAGFAEMVLPKEDEIVFTNCNVCGIKLRTKEEHEMGMCDRCAKE